MIDLTTPRPCATRTEAQHAYLADLIGVAVDESSAGLVGRCKVAVAVVTDGGQVVASYSVPSNSDPDLWYALARTDKGGVFCACPSFEYRGRCSHIEATEEAPAVREPQPFKVGDPVVYTNPRDGDQVVGQVAAVAGERVTMSTATGAYRNFPIAHITPWQAPSVDRKAAIERRAAQAYSDLFTDAA